MVCEVADLEIVVPVAVVGDDDEASVAIDLANVLCVTGYKGVPSVVSLLIRSGGEVVEVRNSVPLRQKRAERSWPRPGTRHPFQP